MMVVVFLVVVVVIFGGDAGGFCESAVAVICGFIIIAFFLIAHIRAADAAAAALLTSRRRSHMARIVAMICVLGVGSDAPACPIFKVLGEELPRASADGWRQRLDRGKGALSAPCLFSNVNEAFVRRRRVPEH